MFRKTIVEVINDIWPMILIFSVILISVRMAYLIKSKTKFILYKELAGLIFIVYIMCIFHIVTFQDVNFGDSNLVPFKEITRYDFGTHKFFKNVIGNMILFIPYGYFISYYLKTYKARTIFILTLIASITIETTQYYIGRVFDIDDIILNVLGGIIGYYLYIGFEAIRKKLPKFMQSTLFLNILTILIIIAFGLYLMNFLKLGNI